MAEHADREGDIQKKAILEEFAVRSQDLVRRATIDTMAVQTLAALSRARIDALLLKGAALARTLYRPNEARSYFDIDLLVAPTDVAPAGRVLRDLGFASLNELQGVEDMAGSLHSEIWARSSPGFGNLTIDLHWRLDGCEAAPEAAWEVLSANTQYVDVVGQDVATLTSPGLALHLALHAAQHGPEDVKALGDLRRGLGRWSTGVWQQALELAAELEALAAFSEGLRLIPAGSILADRLGVDVPDPKATIDARRRRPRGSFHLDALREAGGWRARMRLLRRAIAPSPAWIRWEYRWARRGPLSLAVAYALHMLRTPAWATRAWLHGRRAAGDAP